MSAALKAIWVPVILALTVSITALSDEELDFDFLFFLPCLIVITAHFYTTHFFGARYFAVHYLSGAIYWRMVSIAYLPLIASFWIGLLVHEPTEHHFDALVYPIAGLLVSVISFAVMAISKVRHDLDVILGWTFIIAVIGALSLWTYAALVIQVFDWLL